MAGLSQYSCQHHMPRVRPSSFNNADQEAAIQQLGAAFISTGVVCAPPKSPNLFPTIFRDAISYLPAELSFPSPLPADLPACPPARPAHPMRRTLNFRCPNNKRFPAFSSTGRDFQERKKNVTKKKSHRNIKYKNPKEVTLTETNEGRKS